MLDHTSNEEPSDGQPPRQESQAEQPTALPGGTLPHADKMAWKSALGLADSSWYGIGGHLGQLVSAAAAKSGLNACDLANLLRKKGNEHIEPAFVEEYLAGRASFGCFFFLLAEDLGIIAADIFPAGSPDTRDQDVALLQAYLADSSNEDAVVVYLEHKPGAELREFVRGFLSEKRAGLIAKPSQSFSLGLGIEPAEFDAGLIGVVRKSLCPAQQLLLPAGTLADKAELSVQTVTLTNDDPTRRIAEYVNEKVRNGWSRYSPIEPDDTLVLSPAFMRGKFGFTVDVYPSARTVDLSVSGEPKEQEEKERSWNIGLAAWREAFTQGTFSTVTDIQLIANLAMALEIGVNQLLPVREPTAAERFEIHQRWALAGGGFNPGIELGGMAEFQRRAAERPDPLGRSRFEEDAYFINSSLSVLFGLFERLPKLVADQTAPAELSAGVPQEPTSPL